MKTAAVLLSWIASWVPLLLCRAGDTALHVGPWVGMQSYEESVKVANVQSDWQAAAAGFDAGALADIPGGFQLHLDVRAGWSLTDTEEWIAYGQTLQRNDNRLLALAGRAGVQREWTVDTATSLAPGVGLEYRFQGFERSHFHSRASDTLGQASRVDEDLRLFFAGPTFCMMRALNPTCRVRTTVACLWLLDGHVKNSLVGSSLDASSGRVTSLELDWIWATSDTSEWILSLKGEHQSLKGSQRSRLISKSNPDTPLYELVEWPNNILDTFAIGISRGFRF